MPLSASPVSLRPVELVDLGAVAVWVAWVAWVACVLVLVALGGGRGGGVSSRLRRVLPSLSLSIHVFSSGSRLVSIIFTMSPLPGWGARDTRSIYLTPYTT